MAGQADTLQVHPGPGRVGGLAAPDFVENEAQVGQAGQGLLRRGGRRQGPAQGHGTAGHDRGVAAGVLQGQAPVAVGGPVAQPAFAVVPVTAEAVGEEDQGRAGDALGQVVAAGNGTLAALVVPHLQFLPHPAGAAGGVVVGG